jgi:hypothetical protein
MTTTSAAPVAAPRQGDDLLKLPFFLIDAALKKARVFIHTLVSFLQVCQAGTRRVATFQKVNPCIKTKRSWLMFLAS